MEQLPNYVGGAGVGAGPGAPSMPQQGQPPQQQQQHQQQFQQNAQSLPYGAAGMQVPPGGATNPPPNFFMQNPSQMPPGFYPGVPPNSTGALNTPMAARLPQAQTHAGAQHGFGTQTAGPAHISKPLLAGTGMPGSNSDSAAGMMMMNQGLGANPVNFPPQAIRPGGMNPMFNQQSLAQAKSPSVATTLPTNMAVANAMFDTPRATSQTPMRPNMASVPPGQQRMQQFSQPGMPAPPFSGPPQQQPQLAQAGPSPASNPTQANTTSPRDIARDKARVTLLLEINNALLQELCSLQAAGKSFPLPDKSQHGHSQSTGSASGAPSSAGSPTSQSQQQQQQQKPTPKIPPNADYFHCIRRLQANLNYLASVADHDKKSQNSSTPVANNPSHAVPAVLTAPPNLPALEPLYAKLNELFPGAAASQATAQARAQAAAAAQAAQAAIAQGAKIPMPTLSGGGGGNATPQPAASTGAGPGSGAVTSGNMGMSMPVPMPMNRMPGVGGVPGVGGATGAMQGPGGMPGNMQAMPGAPIQGRGPMPGMPGHIGQGPQMYPASMQQMHMLNAMPGQMGMQMPGQIGFGGVPPGAGSLGPGNVPGSDNSQGMIGTPSTMMGNPGNMNG